MEKGHKRAAERDMVAKEKVMAAKAGEKAKERKAGERECMV